MLVYFAILSLLLYVALITVFVIGWNKIPEFVYTPTTDTLIKVSVVVACKNEAHNLPKLLQALQSQTYANFELVIINDHSADQSLEILNANKHYFNNIQILNAIGHGKKQAIKQAVLAAQGDLILCTDADCIPVATWVESIVHFQLANVADLIICPIKLTHKPSLFARLQELDFATLVGSGAGAAGARIPIMCNAANMAFTKQSWLDSQQDLKPNVMSGDDVFLLHSIKKRNGKIRFLKSASSMVETQSLDTLKAFMNQRRRWASKSSSYTDSAIIATAIIVTLICVLQFISLVSVVYKLQFLLPLFILYTVKSIVDYSFILSFKNLLISNFRFYSFFILTLIYPIVFVLIGFYTLIGARDKWK